MNHETFMARALRLAERGRYTADPNPSVGCVVVRDGEIVGEGYHRRAGDHHAEVYALKDAGDLARGATAYVTLEPCSFHGRTPACTGALINAGVKRVVAAMADPHPNNAGHGFALLREAGIEVVTPLLESSAQALIPGHVQKYRDGRPRVVVKLAMSLDGRTALADGSSNWITGAEARRDVQRLRARSSAIVTGVATVIADNPRLNVRANELGLDNADEIAGRHRPVYILDSRGRMPRGAALAARDDVTRIQVGDPADSIDGVQYFSADASGRPDLKQVLTWFAAAREHTQVLFECGPTLAGSVVAAGLCDELVIYMAPALMGQHSRPLLQLPEIGNMGALERLQIHDVRQLGADLRITLIPGP